MIPEIYFRVLRVFTEEELEIFQRFVYSKYCFRDGYLKPEDYPEGRAVDEFDQHSAHFLLYPPNSENLAGSFRIVRHTKKHGLPIQKAFELPNIYLDNFCELTRVISQKYNNSLGNDSGIGKSVLFEAVRHAIVFCKQHDLNGWIGMADLLAFLKINKICKNTFMPVSPPIFYQGGWTMPAVLEIEKLFQVLRKDDPKLLRCFEG